MLQFGIDFVGRLNEHFHAIRAKWRESPVELKHSGAIAKNDLSELPDAELLDIIYTLGREVGLAPVKTIEGSLTSAGELAGSGPLPSVPGN